MACPKKLMGGSPNFEYKLMSLCCHESQNKNFQKSFFFLKSSYDFKKETSRILIFSWVSIDEYKKTKVFTVIKILKLL